MGSTSNTALALSGNEFQAGRIIDDSVFYDGNAMSAQEIQNFLNAKVPVCDTNGTQMRGGVTRAQYGTSNGYPPPYTCVKDYVESTPTKGADSYCANTYFGGVKTAAQIIYDVSRACNVSQKALLVLLQKEQSLITDDWPWSIQYRAATGYGCPDTAACDAEYYGFFNQVYNAARQFQRYVKQSNYFNFAGGKTGYIQYNPNAGCGGSNVYLENSATAALYNYTPYQPNSAALNNLYGTGDGCSAYGNRNFWRLFNEWFGTTTAPTFSWRVEGQAAYTDATKSSAKNLGSLFPGDRAYLTLTVRNTGNFTWSNSGANPINIGTARSFGRNSSFADTTWLSPSRAARMNESSVAPGQVATFNFWIKAPQSLIGSNSEYFSLVSEGNSWFPDIGLLYNFNVLKPTYTWDLVSQYAASDEAFTQGRSLINLEPGERLHVNLRMRNTGNVTWYNSGSNPVHLGISRPYDRFSYFFDSSWLGQNRPAKMKEASVAPGQVATFEFWMNIPDRPGPFYEYFNPVVEGATWMQDIGLNYYGTIKTPNYSYELTSQYAFSDPAKTTLIGLNNLVRGTTYLVGFTVRNTGNVTWYNSGSNPVRVGTSRPTSRISPFFENSWLGQNRPANMKETSVAPGQIATFEFNYKAPSTPGNYLEYFSLLVEGKAWMQDIGLNFNSRVL